MDTEPISHEIVTQTWQRMSQVDVSRAPQIVKQMEEEQPYVMAYLLASEGLGFTPHEVEIIFYVGLVVWQIMKRGKQQLRRVSRRKMDEAEKANEKFLEMLSSDTEADFESATRTVLENYPEPEVFRYTVEAIMEEEEERDPDDPPIRDEYRGLAFIHLKTVLDALISCRRP